MGLSASQARLLSITARLSDNELHSQQIANSKVRLADKTQRINEEYLDSLNATKLVFSTYDSTGNATQATLTPALMYQYQELKNQYGISNASGQLLVKSTDANNFENSANLEEFLELSGVPLVETTDYINAMTSIFGNGYNANSIVNLDGLTQLNSWVFSLDAINNRTFNDYDNWFGGRPSVPNEISNGASLSFANLVNYLNAVPGNPGDEPTFPPDGLTDPTTIILPTYPSLPSEPTWDQIVVDFPFDLNVSEWNISYGNTICSTVYTPSAGNAYNVGKDLLTNMEQSLGHLIWGAYDLFGNEPYTANGTTYYGITNENGAIIEIPDDIYDDGTYSLTGNNRYTLNADSRNFLDSLFEYADKQGYEFLEEFKNDLLNLYMEVFFRLCKNYQSDSGLKSDIWYDTLGQSYQTIENLQERYKEIFSKLTGSDSDSLQGTAEGIYLDYVRNNPDMFPAEHEQYNSRHEQWESDYAQYLEDRAAYDAAAQARYEAQIAWNDAYETYSENHEAWVQGWQDVKDWQDAWPDIYDAFLLDLSQLNGIDIYTTDQNDPASDWYVNLWHRMNGPSDTKSVEGANGTYWKLLEDNLLNSAEWLQFALENGIVTLEQVQAVEKSEIDTGLDQRQWMYTTYTSCIDIASVEDEVAVAKAEAKYTKDLNEIQAKDKKYDNDIKKLDTEHNALQTEYESVKSVIDKNSERSFKAFS